MTKLNFIVAASVLALASACGTPPQPTADALHPLPPAFFGNGLLVSPGGKTLYTFDGDSSGASSCAGDCAGTWAPFAPAADDKVYGDFTILARDDGSRQWAYKGKPVWLCKLDHVMGDTAGEGRDGAWHAVRAGT
jgi:predicted lipoprotein with Yx(FWY)xxD motif